MEFQDDKNEIEGFVVIVSSLFTSQLSLILLQHEKRYVNW